MDLWNEIILSFIALYFVAFFIALYIMPPKYLDAWLLVGLFIGVYYDDFVFKAIHLLGIWYGLGRVHRGAFGGYRTSEQKDEDPEEEEESEDDESPPKFTSMLYFLTYLITVLVTLAILDMFPTNAFLLACVFVVLLHFDS